MKGLLKSVKILYSRKIPIRFLPINYFSSYKASSEYNDYQLYNLLWKDKIDLRLPASIGPEKYKNVCTNFYNKGTRYIRLIQMDDDDDDSTDWHPLEKINKEGICRDCRSNILETISEDSIMATYEPEGNLYLETYEGTI